ncbi:MAG: efflux RND transporter periplasmic adaptor subunit [Ignavibacteria bacterium]|nr:efflux RND transporter periplasmic adaptor subunit [Ignavibacteria bacterium]
MHGRHHPARAIIPAVLVVLFGSCANDTRGRIEASGTIEGTDVNIGVEVSGRIAQVLVDEGSRVEPDDTLAIINDIDYQLQLRQAMANEAATDAQYRLAIEGSRKEDILQAEAAFKTAAADQKRMEELLASRTITQKQYDETYARYVSAQQTYEKLVRGLRKEEILVARARRDQATAQTDMLRKKVRDCIVRAPVRGTVTLRSIEPGELVTMGAHLVRITYLDEVDLIIYVPEHQLGLIRLGQKAAVSIDTFEGRNFEGRVVYISPVAEFTPKNVQTKEERTKLVFGVKIKVPNPEGVLKPGLPADARIETSEAG